MPTAAETLAGYARKAKRTFADTVAEVYDSVEQKARANRGAQPATDSARRAEEAWDELMKARRAGAPDEDVQAAEDRFADYRDMASRVDMKKYWDSVLGGM